MPTAPQWPIRLFVLSILIFFNVLTFWSHYTGYLTFPYDFLGGYHAHAFGWYSDGSVLKPPRWFPWADLGFPAFIALQSGSWYVPLAILDALDITYSIHTATIVQCLHVLLGACGMFVLLRRLDFSWPIALIGGLCYHFSATFYSNQQHVDILRAAALLPWLFWSLHPSVILHRFGPWISAALVFQYLVAAYPGNIVSGAYSSLAYVVILSLGLDRKIAARYFIVLAVAGTAGVLLSGLKWWPLFESRDAIAYTQKVVLPFSLDFILTILFPYDVSFLPSDVTLRSLWLPSTILCGIFFIRRADKDGVLGLALVLISVGLAVFVSESASSRYIPGLGVSRIPITDWRPTIHIGLIILGSCGWEALYSEKVGRSFLIVRLLLLALALGLSVWFAFQLGYTFNVLRLSLSFAVSAIVLTVAIAVISRKDSRIVPSVGVLLIALLSAQSGYAFHRSQGRPWMMPWSREAQLSYLRADFDGSTQDRLRLSLTRRPSRLLIGNSQQEMLSKFVDTQYNSCWYNATFCVFGYNNILLSKAHAKIHQKFSDPTIGPDLLEFVKRPQQLVLLPKGRAFDVRIIQGTNAKAPVVSLIPEVKVSMVAYSNDIVVLDIDTPIATTVVENEIWWKGWMVQLCQEDRCLPKTTASSTDEALRTWEVPPGKWRASLIFEAKGYGTARVLVGIALLVLAIYSVLGCRSRIPKFSWRECLR
jgi:hypothetical protein